jgi:hypothetical protein
VANTTTITSVNKLIGGCIMVTFKTKLTGSYVQAAGVGEVINLYTAALDPNYLGSAGCMPNLSATNSIAGDIWCTNGDVTNLFQLQGGTPYAMKLKIASSLGGELAAGAYSALLLSDVLEGMVLFNSNI